MKFLNRQNEMARLDRLMSRSAGGLAVLSGRRRMGKTRLLLEWNGRHGGVYTVADLSSADIQRQYFAEAVAQRLPGFADVEYRDWRSLLVRLARDAAAEAWRGPLILDELPYLVASSPELPSVLQRWIDHEAKEAKLVIAVAGSSQRMMQGLVLGSNAPLFGRATEVLTVGPLDADYLEAAFGTTDTGELVQAYASWGGVPRYWELATELRGTPQSRVEHLVLDPLGPLHREPDRLLMEETPSALEVRPVLDAIGAGAHRVAETAARVGRPATSMSRPLGRLVDMGIARREIPFGVSEKKCRRSLYKIDDPFFRMWFRVVAAHRAQLASSTKATRMKLLHKYWDRLVADAWEDICRSKVPALPSRSPLGKLGSWGPASRWWKGNLPEWDVVAEAIEGKALLLGEVKWGTRPMGRQALEHLAGSVASKPAPSLGSRYAGHSSVRVLFVPEVRETKERYVKDVLVVTYADL